MKKIKKYLDEYRTPKRTLAKMIGVSETALYFYLDPTRYFDRTPGERAMAAIAKFEGKSVAAIRREYEERKGVAA